MTEKERIKRIVNDLYYPTLLVGSGVMVMHGMERQLGDLDVMMATQNWFRFFDEVRAFGSGVRGATGHWHLVTTMPDDEARRADPPYLEAEMYGLKVNVFFCWRIRSNGNDVDVNRLWRQSEVIDGVRCSTLRALLEWKLAARREKDVPDILAIIEHCPEIIVR